MPRVIRSLKARRDLVDIAQFVARDKPAAAERWLDRMQELFTLLATQPKMGRPHSIPGHPDARSQTDGSYLVYYRPIAEGVQILRVVHGARDQDAALRR